MTFPIETPEILQPEFEQSALTYLQRYFFPKVNERPFSGAKFETIGHPWNAPESDHVITASDLLSLTTLSVDLDRDAVVRMMSDEFQAKATELLRRIPVTLALQDPEAAHLEDEGSAALELWRHIRMNDVGPTRVSKLMARKRPNLIPIYDSVVARVLGLADANGHWMTMREWITRDNLWVIERARALHAQANLSPLTTDLRTLDVLLWMYGKGDETG